MRRRSTTGRHGTTGRRSTIGRRGTTGRRTTLGQRGGAPGDTAEDVHWAGECRSAVGAAVLLLTSLLVLDTGAGRLTAVRAVLWAGLAALFFVILLPPRVRARPGRLTSRGLCTTHSVRTDALVSVRWSDGVARRLVLRDLDGGRVEIDPDVLVRNPPLWHRLDTDSRTALHRGTLLCGATALRRLAERIDREAARTVFKVSGLL
ncbi:hypothetical protein ACWCQL_01865 [Streptomyces sp. NPDC002073]